MSNKKIGILTTETSHSVSYKEKTLGVEMTYYAFFQQFGDVRIITPDEEPGERHFDLIVLPGGADLSSAVFAKQDAKYLVESQEDNPAYTYFYKNSFDKWVQSGIPMFGICLGAQAIGKAFGLQIENIHGHSQGYHGLHDVRLAFGYQKFNYVNKDKAKVYEVNSRHHQAIFKTSDTSPAYIIAQALDGGLHGHVEAFGIMGRPIVGVQWHPEDIVGYKKRGDALAIALITKLLDYDGKAIEWQNI
jgi:gamma-glutamyl-gamma-aminobutyrate hydrolase PuuD